MSGDAPLIVTALFAPEYQAWLDDLRRRHYPPERNQLAAHCTMFHHLSPSLARELKQRLSAATRGEAPPQARIGGVMDLGGGVALRVESPGLEAIRADLADAFAPMLVPQDRAGWRPHVTIQNKVAPAGAKALRVRLEQDFAPRPLRIAGLALWHYLGGPWELAGRYSFRG